MAKMCHLHLHSNYSILDAISKPKEIVVRVKDLGHTAVAITDHGTIAGTIEFYRECKKQNIKPILGCEFYFVADHEQDKINAKIDGKRASRNYHLICLAMNDTGWRNIKILNTIANEQYYFKPRIDFNALNKYNEGIICTSACIHGIVANSLENEKLTEAAKYAGMFKELFGDRFYLETQDGGLNAQPDVNKLIRRLGEHLHIPIIATQDSHYIDKDDVISHEAIWAIRTNDTFDKPTGYGKGKEFRPYYSTNEYWLKDINDMLSPLITEDRIERPSSLLQEEIERTLEIEDRIGDINIEKKMHLPKYEHMPLELKSSPYEYLIELVMKGYKERFGEDIKDAPEEYKERIRKELRDIKDAKLEDYFLIIWDIVSWARSQNIPVGPGRGSAAGSMVSYVLGITGLDPIKYGLIWERFYNIGRKGSMADIDLDFSRARRGDVIDYIEKRFGVDKVAQMGTINTLKSKAALKDTAKILGKRGMSFDDANVMTKYVPFKVKDLDDALSRSDKLKEYEENNEELFRIAKKLEGCPKSSGQHPAGVLISDESFMDGCVPLRWNTKEKKLITEYDGDTLDSLGYLKVDVLGLNTMDVLFNTQEDVNKRLENDES